MMKTQQELQLHYWGPHYEMVKEYNAKHGTDIQPWESVRFWDSKSCGFLGNPLFNDRLGHYDFALTILYDDKRKEHRPVFVGDTVYDKLIAIKLKVIDYDTLQCDDLKFTNLNWDKLSWNQPAPKRTFKLELDEQEFEFARHIMKVYAKDMHGMAVSINEKLTLAARDKE